MGKSRLLTFPRSGVFHGPFTHKLCYRSCKTKAGTKAYRLTYKDSGQKTLIVYIPRNRLSEMKRLTANYARARSLMQKIIATNIAIFKKG